MLYPTNIKVEKKEKTLKEKINQFKVETKEKFKYFIKDRRNWGKKMLVIWHI